VAQGLNVNYLLEVWKSSKNRAHQVDYRKDLEFMNK